MFLIVPDRRKATCQVDPNGLLDALDTASLRFLWMHKALPHQIRRVAPRRKCKTRDMLLLLWRRVGTGPLVSSVSGGRPHGGRGAEKCMLGGALVNQR